MHLCAAFFMCVANRAELSTEIQNPVENPPYK